MMPIDFPTDRPIVPLSPLTAMRGFLIGLGLLGLLGSAVFAGTGEALARHPLNAAQRAPLQSFVVGEYRGGRVDFSAYRGRVVLVNFWATWCAPCIAEFPSLQGLKRSFAGQPFEILAINIGEHDDAIASFIATLEGALNFPILVDETLVNDWGLTLDPSPQVSPRSKWYDSVASNWSVRALPTTFIVDKAGRLAFTVRGARNWNNADIRARIHPLLHE